MDVPSSTKTDHNAKGMISFYSATKIPKRQLSSLLSSTKELVLHHNHGERIKHDRVSGHQHSHDVHSVIQTVEISHMLYKHPWDILVFCSLSHSPRTKGQEGHQAHPQSQLLVPKKVVRQPLKSHSFKRSPSTVKVKNVHTPSPTRSFKGNNS